MSIFDYVSGAKEGRKPYHSYGFAEKSRQDRIGSVSVSPFKKRQAIEKKRKTIGAYKISKVAYDIDAKRELLKEQRRLKALRKQWILRRMLYGSPRPIPTIELRSIPSIQQYRYKPARKNKKRFSRVYMAQPKETDKEGIDNGQNNP